LEFEDLTDQLGFVLFVGKSVSDVFEKFAFPEFFVIFHQSGKKFKKTLYDQQALELRMLNFHHFKHICILRILKVFFDLFRLVDLKLLKTLKELFMEFLRQRRQIFIVHDFS